MKKLFYITIIIFSTLNFGFTPTTKEYLNDARTVWVQLDEPTKTFLIEGEGKTKNQKLRNYVLKIFDSGTGDNGYNKEEYTIRIKDNRVKFPDDSYYLFAANDEERPRDPLKPLNILVVIPSDMNTSNVTRMRGMFAFLLNANPDVTNFDVSNVTDLSHMFKNMNKSNPNVSNWVVTDKVTEIQWMFYDNKLANPDVSKWDTSNVVNMNGIFASAPKAQPNVTNWKTDNVTMMEYLFSNTKVANPDITNWNFSRVTKMKEIFREAKAVSSTAIEHILNLNNSLNSESIDMIKGTNLYKRQIDKINNSYSEEKAALIAKLNSNNLSSIKEVVDKPDTKLNEAKDKLKQIATEGKNIPDSQLGKTLTRDKLNQLIQKAEQMANDPNITILKESSVADIDGTQTEALEPVQIELSNQITKLKKEIAEVQAKAKIDELTSLSQPQKDVFKDKVTNANTVDEINEIVNNATELDSKKNELQNKLSEANNVLTNNKDKATEQSVKVLETVIYDADLEKDKRITDVPTLQAEIAKLNSAISNVKTEAKSLTDARMNAISEINGLKVLNETQKQKYIDKVNIEKDKTEISKIVTTAKELDTKKGELNSKIEEAEGISADDRNKATEESLKNLDEALKTAKNEKEKKRYNKRRITNIFR